MAQPPYSDPVADPVLANQTVIREPSGGRGGFIAAGIIAALLVVALIAFTSGPGTDPATTAVIPAQEDQAVPTPEASPSIAPSEVPPADDTQAAPTPPAPQPPAANQ